MMNSTIMTKYSSDIKLKNYMPLFLCGYNYAKNINRARKCPSFRMQLSFFSTVRKDTIKPELMVRYMVIVT